MTDRYLKTTNRIYESDFNSRIIENRKLNLLAPKRRPLSVIAVIRQLDEDKTENDVAKGNQTPSRSWVSRIIAGRLARAESSRSGAKRPRSGWLRSCERLKRSCAIGCTSRSRPSVNGCI